jgi:hypothetical protein
VLGGAKRQAYAKKSAIVVRALLQTELINAIRRLGSRAQRVRDACKNNNGVEELMTDLHHSLVTLQQQEPSRTKATDLVQAVTTAELEQGARERELMDTIAELQATNARLEAQLNRRPQKDAMA